MRDGIIIAFGLFAVLSVFFIVEGRFSKVVFTVITLSVSFMLAFNGVKEYFAFPVKIEKALVDYAPSVQWWVQRYNSFVVAVVGAAVVFFFLQFVLIWLQKEKIFKWGVYFVPVLAAVVAVTVVVAAIGYGLMHINKYFDFASCVLGVSAKVSGIIILCTATYLKWNQEKL